MSSNYLHIIRGDSYGFSCNVAVGDVPQPLDGASVYMALYWRDCAKAGEELALLSTANGEIVVSGNNNAQLDVTLTAAGSNAIQACPCAEWYLRTKTGAGFVYTLDHGLAAIVEGHPDIP